MILTTSLLKHLPTVAEIGATIASAHNWVAITKASRAHLVRDLAHIRTQLTEALHLVAKLEGELEREIADTGCPDCNELRHQACGAGRFCAKHEAWFDRQDRLEGRS